MRRWLMVLALLGALLPATALAHVKLASSNPAAGSTIASAPATMELVFDGEVGGEGLSVTVTGPGGARADQGDAKLDLNDIDRKRVLVSLKSGLAGGAYAVDWVVVGADGHEITGSFSFAIQGAAPAPAPTATSAPAATATPAPAATTRPLATATPAPATAAQPDTAALPATGAERTSLAPLLAAGLLAIGLALLLKRRAARA